MLGKLDLLFNRHEHIETHLRQSVHLGRAVRVDVWLPPHYLSHAGRYPLLLFNDGQDMPGLRLAETLETLMASHRMRRIVVAAIYPEHHRIHEYGTACQPDYQGRGARAARYSRFVVQELLPFLHHRYRLAADPLLTGFAGCSLGGLSAFDIAWNHPEHFRFAGVFSGALWWRSKAYEDGYVDQDRLIHNVVRFGEMPEQFRAWFEAGTEDETDDRNGNGIIDAIDDTLDLLAELRAKGCPEHQLRYLEIPGGKHDLPTWAQALPDFLAWAYPPDPAQRH
ncbi:MAG: alpha/beta hydrolase-fold protein [Bacteroidia bacterium]|nr:alpha/beta hydrolase-fold protein [Bacteroidia bacterium]